MFLEHFGLRANPFDVVADPQFLYVAEGHREALSAIYLNIVEGGGVSVLLAEPGLGKTTLLRYVMARLEGRAAAALFPHPYRDRGDLMREVIAKVGMTHTAGGEFEQMRKLQQRLAELKSRGYHLVLLFDEAQALSSETLEQIRLLSNLRSTSQNLLEIVLAGQSELADLLESPQHDALRQRVHTVARLEPFTNEDVAAYVAHRLKTAGGADDLFDAGALACLFDYSRGVPRLVNQLCHKALAIAWDRDAPRADEAAVREAALELAISRTRRKTVRADHASQATPRPIEIREGLR